MLLLFQHLFSIDSLAPITISCKVLKDQKVLHVLPLLAKLTSSFEQQRLYFRRANAFLLYVDCCRLRDRRRSWLVYLETAILTSLPFTHSRGSASQQQWIVLGGFTLRDYTRTEKARQCGDWQIAQWPRCLSGDLTHSIEQRTSNGGLYNVTLPLAAVWLLQ